MNYEELRIVAVVVGDAGTHGVRSISSRSSRSCGAPGRTERGSEVLGSSRKSEEGLGSLNFLVES